MRPTTIHAIDPVGRFKEIYNALDAQSAWWSDNAWLRFAAQAAVMRPAAPSDTAHAIRQNAEALRQRSRWFEALATPLNLVVAASLIQSGDTVDAFDNDFDASRDLLRQAGLRAGGAHEILAVLALRVLSQAKAPSEPVIQRMHRIYQRMKTHHWWLTGKEDIIACALLTTCPGTPEEIAGIADGIYHALHDRGFKAGNHLQTASNLLPLTGLSATVAATHFSALADAFRGHSRSVWQENYAAIALLGLLDHESERIVGRFYETLEALHSLHPSLPSEVNFNIASDLTFLDLVRFDRHMRPLTDSVEADRMEALIRLQRAASFILVEVPPTPIVVGEFGWPAISTIPTNI